jgi:hypothetical protein
MEIRCSDHATPSIRKTLALTSATSGCRSVGIVRLQTQSTECIIIIIIIMTASMV